MRGDKDVNDDRIWSRNCSGFHPVTTLHLFSFFFWDQPIAVICASGKTWSRSNQAQGIATPPTFPLHINPRFWGRSYNGLLIFKINFTRLNSQQSRPKKEMTPKIWTSTKKVCGYHELVFTKTSVLFFFIACIYIYIGLIFKKQTKKHLKKTSETLRCPTSRDPLWDPRSSFRAPPQLSLAHWPSKYGDQNHILLDDLRLSHMILDSLILSRWFRIIYQDGFGLF